MTALIVNGAIEKRKHSASDRIAGFLQEQFEYLGVESEVFKIAEAGIPFFDTSSDSIPPSVTRMNNQFRTADIHVWLSPLFHGSMTGMLKNCLDWLELTAKEPNPYLTGKLVGLICWADGVQAMQGINAMDAVAKALRAWTSPYSVPIIRGNLFGLDNDINEKYEERFKLLLYLLTKGPR